MVWAVGVDLLSLVLLRSLPSSMVWMSMVEMVIVVGAMEEDQCSTRRKSVDVREEKFQIFQKFHGDSRRKFWNSRYSIPSRSNTAAPPETAAKDRHVPYLP